MGLVGTLRNRIETHDIDGLRTPSGTPPILMLDLDPPQCGNNMCVTWSTVESGTRGEPVTKRFVKSRWTWRPVAIGRFSPLTRGLYPILRFKTSCLYLSNVQYIVPEAKIGRDHHRLDINTYAFLHWSIDAHCMSKASNLRRNPPPRTPRSFGPSNSNLKLKVITGGRGDP